MADKLREEFNKTLDKLKVINKPKSLIVDGKLLKEFEANGSKYIICAPDKVFNIGRQTAYYNINTAFALNQTPTEIKQRFNKTWSDILRLMSAEAGEKKKLMDGFVRDALNNNDSFKGELTSRYPMAYYLCTLFIIKEGEDLAEWSFESANEKIDDWVKENISSVDFFGIAQASSIECQEILKESYQTS